MCEHGNCSTPRRSGTSRWAVRYTSQLAHLADRAHGRDEMAAQSKRCPARIPVRVLRPCFGQQLGQCFKQQAQLFL